MPETQDERRARLRSRGWVGVDLDGTLATYESWPADGSVGAPVEMMLDRVRSWLADGIDVRIFTARVSDGDPRGQREVISAWLVEHVGVADHERERFLDDRTVGRSGCSDRREHRAARGREDLSVRGRLLGTLR